MTLARQWLRRPLPKICSRQDSVLMRRDYMMERGVQKRAAQSRSRPACICDWSFAGGD